MIKAKYSIVLKTIMDDSESKKLLDQALSSYPLYTPEHESKFSQVVNRSEINSKLLNHYKYREIGFESFGRFLDELEITMNEIMPRYNQLLVSQDIINGLDDIFGNLDVKEEYTETSSGTSKNDTINSETSTSEGSETGSSSSEGKNTSSSSGTATDSTSTSSSMDTAGKKVKSDTPKNQLGLTANDIDNITYANEIEWNKDHSSNSGTSEGSSTNSSEGETTAQSSSQATNTKNEEVNKNGSINSQGQTSNSVEHTLHRKGNQGVNTYAHDMNEFRGLIMDIVMMIIQDPKIEDLFMKVY